MYSAHWDSFGINPAATGDQIMNGALDDGSGMGVMLAMAEAFAKMPVRPKRSVLFFSPTAEEATMLGAKYYAQQPLWPLEKTLADINMDIMNFWGRTHAIVSIGKGMTTLDDILDTGKTLASVLAKLRALKPRRIKAQTIQKSGGCTLLFGCCIIMGIGCENICCMIPQSLPRGTQCLIALSIGGQSQFCCGLAGRLPQSHHRITQIRLSVIHDRSHPLANAMSSR